MNVDTGTLRGPQTAACVCYIKSDASVHFRKNCLPDRTPAFLFNIKYLTQLRPEHALSWAVRVYSHTLWVFRRTGSDQEWKTVDWWFAVLVWVVNSPQWHQSSGGMTGMRRWYLPCWQHCTLILLCSDSGISPTVTLVYLDSHDSYQTQSEKMYSCASSTMWPLTPLAPNLTSNSKRWDVWVLIPRQFSCSDGQSCPCDTSMIWSHEGDLSEWPDHLHIPQTDS